MKTLTIPPGHRVLHAPSRVKSLYYRSVKRQAFLLEDGSTRSVTEGVKRHTKNHPKRSVPGDTFYITSLPAGMVRATPRRTLCLFLGGKSLECLDDFNNRDYKECKTDGNAVCKRIKVCEIEHVCKERHFDNGGCKCK